MKCVGAGLSVLVLVVLASACQSALYKPARWQVEVSSLDYVTYVCGFNATNRLAAGAVPAQALRVELLGNGHMTCWQGGSPRVASEFWESRKDDRWDEYRTDSVHVGEAYVSACFQYLVDTGFFEEDLFGSGNKKDAAAQGIMVMASINGRKKAAFTNDPRIIASVHELMKQF